MLPTPDLSHLTWKDFEHVYEPSEDTFILLDALEQDLEALRAQHSSLCLEIGSGSGCVSTFLSGALQSRPVCLCTDINVKACQATQATAFKNKTRLDPVLTSLVEALSPRLHGQVDVLLFNPPYVPTEEEEVRQAQEQGRIAGSWAGGSIGMNVTDQLLDQVSTLLAPGGRFYLVAVPRNQPAEIIKRMQQEQNLQSEIVLQRRAGRERLCVIRCIRSR